MKAIEEGRIPLAHIAWSRIYNEQNQIETATGISDEIILLIPGLWGMTTSMIQQKGLPKDYFVHIKRDSLVSQKWGETP